MGLSYLHQPNQASLAYRLLFCGKIEAEVKITVEGDSMNQLALDLQPTEPSYRLIPLTQGQFAKVDEEDYKRVMEFKWLAHKTRNNQFRAQRCFGQKRGVSHGYFVQLANFVLNQPRGVMIDHIE